MKIIERMNSQYKNGIVIQVSNFKTCTVNVNRVVKHKKYGKTIRKSKKYKVQIPSNPFFLKATPIKVYPGDRIRIRATRPISKTKKWVIYDFL